MPRIMNLRHLGIAVVSFSLFFGCGSKDQAQSQEDLSPISSNVVYADGWAEITIHANYAKTVVDDVAHLTTDRNGCWKDGYAAIELGQWNDLVSQVNRAIKLAPGPEKCFPMDDSGAKTMDGTVEVKISESRKVALYEAKGDQVCTKIPDVDLARSLLTTIDGIVIAADKADCPHGFGS